MHFRNIHTGGIPESKILVLLQYLYPHIGIGSIHPLLIAMDRSGLDLFLPTHRPDLN